MILYIKHVSIEGPDLIGDFFKKKGYNSVTVDLSSGDVLPADIDNFKAVVILGGPMNVYEEEKYPFLREEDIFIKNIIKKDVPCIGLCLGAQLIAKASGTSVKRADEKEKGFYTVYLTEEGSKDLIFKGLDKNFTVFQWHEDTFDKPSGGSIIVKGKSCVNQGLKLGDNVYGFQFHFETTLESIKEWVKEYEGKGVYFPEIPEDIRIFEKYAKDTGKTAEIICSNFEEIIKKGRKV